MLSQGDYICNQNDIEIMTKTTVFFNSIVFYVSVIVFAIFVSGGCETFIWYIPTAICGYMMYRFGKVYSEKEWRVFTGVNYVQHKTGIDLFSEE